MLGPTHKAFGLTLASTTLMLGYQPLLSQSQNPETTGLLIAQFGITLVTAWASSTLPDIDRHFKKHRGITHAIWAPLIILYLYWLNYDTRFISPVLLGLFMGYMSHLIGDAFSKAGIAWFYPFQKYKYYPNGAFHVVGKRGPFRPLYYVGESIGINAALLWYIITVVISFFLWARI